MMFLVVVTLFSALILAAATAYSRRERKHVDTGNTELDAFYAMESEPSLVQMRQLTKAARCSLDGKRTLERQIQTLSMLHEEGLVSDGYYNDALRQDEELVVEKIIIEGDAEMLQPGSKDTIFADAAKLPSTEKCAQKKKFFDEAPYLKKREIFMGKVSANAAGSA